MQSVHNLNMSDVPSDVVLGPCCSEIAVTPKTYGGVTNDNLSSTYTNIKNVSIFTIVHFSTTSTNTQL